MMEDFLCFVGVCLAMVGGYALLLAMIRVMAWLTEVILLGGW